MRIALLFCLFFAGALHLKAQTTALDFVKTDCEGANHHLFTELDSGYVCIIEFVMMACQPCIVAAHGLETIHDQFELSHPGKVRHYTIGFLNSISCLQMKNWKTQNQLTSTIFAGDAQQVSYYGGMGMPTIVILGGLNQHKVYYNQLGYSSAENTPIINAINLAISESTTSAVAPEPGQTALGAAPNPFDNTLRVSFGSSDATHLVLTDLTGREVLRQDIAASAGTVEVDVDTQQLRPGFYVLGLYNGKQRIAHQKLIKA